MANVHLTSENVISLRTAVFRDDGFVATLHLLPRYQGDTEKIGWVFRRRLPLLKQIRRRFVHPDLAKIESELRADPIPERPPVCFKWSENGLNVAVLIDSEPWAFVHESFNKGFSKSIKRAGLIGNCWDEELYRKTFL